MNIKSYLVKLESSGIRVSLQGDNIKLDYPQGALTENTRETLKENKEAIICILSDENNRSEPFIAGNGDLCIPFNADRKYQWWAGGMSVSGIKKHMLN